MSEKIYEGAWKYALEELQKEYHLKNKDSEFIFNFNINYVEDNNNIITVSVPSLFMKNQVTSKGSLEIIKNKLKEITGLDNIELDCIIKNDISKESVKQEIPVNIIKEEINNVQEIPTITKTPKKKHPQLKEEFNFDTFIPGDGSRYAYNAAMNVAENPGKEKNPILFYGGSGLGKTHLMQAIGNYINEKNPKLKICYISAENFTNEFLDSLRTKKTTEFKNKYRNLDVLLLDDIHFLQGKEQTQEEVFYTFNNLYDNKKQMVFTCDRPIKEIKNMAERLISRLSNGLCIDIQTPNYEDRYAILQKKLELYNTFLEPEIIDYIAKNIETNVRDLESALKNILGWRDLVGKNITLNDAKKVLKDFININNVENISMDVIVKVIAENYQISISDLKGKKRDKKYVYPRKIAIYIIRELTELAYSEIAREFGKDHSTIMSAYNSISDKIKLDPSLEEKINIYIREIKNYKKI